MQKTFLSSIEEEEQENEEKIHTQMRLFKIYHQLYLVNYAPIFTQQPILLFEQISKEINEKNQPDYSNFQPFSLDYAEKKKQMFRQELERKMGKQTQVKRYMTVDDFEKEMKRRGITPTKKQNSQVPLLKTQRRQRVAKSNERNTVSTANSLNDMLSQLNEFDQIRSQIKSQIYIEEDENVKNLYEKWGSIHSDMKDTLESSMNMIGCGKQLDEMYDDFNQQKYLREKIQGHSKHQIFNKLDGYLQSLYFDERQLILYEEENRLKKENIMKLSKPPICRKLNF